MMRDLLPLLLAACAGSVIGILYFAGLWWTVRRCVTARDPAILMLVSVLVRVSVTLAGFYVVCGHVWQKWLACLAGWSAARVIVGLFSRNASWPPARSGEGVHHAP